MQMRLFDRQGRRAASGRSSVNGLLRGQGGAGDRMLMRFTYPNDIAGTGFLVWEHPGGDDERFLYLPALGRVRRIAGSERQESFVGSDFTYEDIGGRELEDYAYALLDANATWTDADGARHPAWRLESQREARRRDVSARRLARPQGQLRRRRAPRSSTGATNARRTTACSTLAQVEGIWTAMAVDMTNELDRTRTELTSPGALQRRPQRERLQPPRAGARRESHAAARVSHRARLGGSSIASASSHA